MGCFSSSLNECTLDNTEEFTLQGKYKVKVIEVYDGDTVTVAFKEGTRNCKKRGRLIGINAPEIRTKNQEEKERGYEAKTEMEKLCLNKLGNAVFYGFDNFGRVLMTLNINGVDISKKMMNSGHAVEFQGRVKIERT
jgi:endonuclease YncB( thermonuclease family)